MKGAGDSSGLVQRLLSTVSLLGEELRLSPSIATESEASRDTMGFTPDRERHLTGTFDGVLGGAKIEVRARLKRRTSCGY